MPVPLTPEAVQEQTRTVVTPTLDELAREGAHRMLAAALELEVAEYISRHAGERGEDGLRRVVRNGRAEPSRGRW